MIIQIFLPIVLAFIMFSMGLDLTVKDFKNVFKFPKAFSVGILLQVVLLPAIAFLIAYYLELPSFISVGLIIIACCPGGVTSNYLTHLAKGETALSVSLTAIASLVGIITVPLIIKLGLEKFAENGVTDFSVLTASLEIFLMTTVPVSLGMVVNNRFSDFTKKYSGKFSKISAIFFVLLVIGAIIKQRQMIFDYFPQVGFSVLGLNIATMLSAILAARIFKLRRDQEITLTIECGFQNATLAMVVATTILKSTEYMVTAGIYGILMFFTAGAYLFIVKKTRA